MSNKKYINDEEIVKCIAKPNLITLLFELLISKASILVILTTIILYIFANNLSPRLKSGNIILYMTLIPIILFLVYLGYILIYYSFIEYVITDKVLYKKVGIIKQIIIAKPFNEISHITIQRGLIDRLVGTGDIIINNGPYINKKKYCDGDNCDGLVLTDISEYNEIFDYIKKQQCITNNFVNNK